MDEPQKPDLLPQFNPPNLETTHSISSLFRGPSIPFVFLRLFLYLALMEGFAYGLRALALVLLRSQQLSFLRRISIFESIDLASVLLAALAMSLMERRSFGDYGLPWRPKFLKLFSLGAFFGLAEISMVLGFAAAFHAYHFGSLAIHGSELWRWAVFWGAFFLVVGLYEEFAFRGYVQFTLGRGLGFWPSAFALSLLFGYVHIGNEGESWTGIAGVILTGLLWCFTLRRTGSLWFAVGMHAAFDFGETFLYSVPDSGVVFPGHLSNATLQGPTWLTGGSAGPEGSVLDFLVLLVFFFVFHRLFPVKADASPTGEKHEISMHEISHQDEPHTL